MAVVSGYYISILTVVVVMVVVVVTEVVVVVVGLGKASWCRTGRVRIISRGVRTLICWSGSGGEGGLASGSSARGGSGKREREGLAGFRPEGLKLPGGEVCTPATFMVVALETTLHDSEVSSEALEVRLSELTSCREQDDTRGELYPWVPEGGERGGWGVLELSTDKGERGSGEEEPGGSRAQLPWGMMTRPLRNYKDDNRKGECHYVNLYLMQLGPRFN